MPQLRADTTVATGTAILERLGVERSDAVLVAQELVTAHQMGLESHGVIRFAQYVRDLRNGRIVARAKPVVERDTATTAILDGGDGLGQVTAIRATDLAIEKAGVSGIACIATRRCNHVGRLGSYVERAARAGMVSLAVAAIPSIGHFVVPWGGAAGRLGTNPIAYAFPTETDPIVADFATSVIPEGRVRAARNQSIELPAGAVVDADGNPTTDPAAFYGPPMGGLLPFGGPAGHKGYAMGVFVELLGATLLGEAADALERGVNGMTIIAIDPGRFGDPAVATSAASGLVDYLRSSPSTSGDGPVLVPGEREYRRLASSLGHGRLSVDDETWREFCQIATSLDLEPPAVEPGEGPWT